MSCTCGFMTFSDYLPQSSVCILITVICLHFAHSKLSTVLRYQRSSTSREWVVFCCIHFEQINLFQNASFFALVAVQTRAKAAWIGEIGAYEINFVTPIKSCWIFHQGDTLFVWQVTTCAVNDVKNVSASRWLCLSSFPRVETRFNTHYQNVCKRLSGVVAFIIEFDREYESRGRPRHCAAALRSLIRRAEIM